MIFDNPPDQIAWRRALSSGKHLELLEARLGKFHCSLHNNHCPMSRSLWELLTMDRAFARINLQGLQRSNTVWGGVSRPPTFDPQTSHSSYYLRVAFLF